MKRIAVLTSGGDSPGMNAAIRAVVRYAGFKNIETVGVIAGYKGLVNADFIPLYHCSVSNIINRGGTILKTARCEEFKTEAGQKKAVENLKKNKIDGLVVIGGDGSYRGAHEFSSRGVAVIGVPGTIDNDICGTDKTIGCDTAVDTALEAIDKIRDTATSLERIYLVEVMGRESGYIAIHVGLGAGAEDCLIPERKFNLKKMCEDIKQGNKKGKVSWIIVVAEGAAKASDVARDITKVTGLETRVAVLGYIQRGGIPQAADRILAIRLGAAAVDLLIKGETDKAVGIMAGKINVVDLEQASKKRDIEVDALYELVRIVT